MDYNLSINTKPLKLFNPIDMTFAQFFQNIFYINEFRSSLDPLRF